MKFALGFLKAGRSLQPAGYDYYIDPVHGSSANPGSRLLPFLNLQDLRLILLPVTGSVTLTLSASTVGAGRTATKTGQTFSAADIGKWFSFYGASGDASSNAGAGFITAVDGSGMATVTITTAAAATVFTSAQWEICPLQEGTTTVFIGAATWTGPAVAGQSDGALADQTFGVQRIPATTTTISMTFEAGTIFDDFHSPGHPERSAFFIQGGRNYVIKVIGDPVTPLISRNYGGDGVILNGSGQCWATGGYARIEVSDAVGSESGEIISFHEHGTGKMTRVVGYNGIKTTIANVDSSVCEHVDCTYYTDQGAPVSYIPGAFYGQITNTSTGDTFTRTAIHSGPASVGAADITMAPGDTYTQCILGTPTLPLDLRVKPTGGAQLTDCYINGFGNQNLACIFTRCYGRLTLRQNSSIAGETKVLSCVFLDGATGQTDGLLFRNFDPGSAAKFTATNSVIAGYTTALGNGFGVSDSNYFIAAGSTITFCDFFSNGTNVDADLVTANTNDGGTKIANNLTLDPVLAGGSLAAVLATTAQANYCVTAAGLNGTGSGGANIGFRAGDIP